MNMAMKKRSWSLLGGGMTTLLLAASTAGCSYIEQAQDSAAMTSVVEVRRAQTLNPAAGANRKAVASLNGEAAQNVSDAYAKSFVPKEAGGANDLFLGLQGVGGGK